MRLNLKLLKNKILLRLILFLLLPIQGESKLESLVYTNLKYLFSLK